MVELVLVLGAAVVKTAVNLWTGGNAFATEVAGDLSDLIKGRVNGVLDQRKARRQFEQMEEVVARQILTAMDSEFRDLDEGERNAAIIAASDTISDARLTDRTLFAGNLDPLYLERFLRRSTGEKARDLSSGAAELYDRVLAQCSAYIIEIADKLPRFQVGAFTELLQRDTQILNRLEDVLERLPVSGRDDSTPSRVETAYRQRIVKSFDRLELFGLDFAAQWYSLSIAYVNLQVSVQRATERRSESFEYWLAEYPRLLIDGRAGSGKTTILQWIAVRAARRDFSGPATALNGLIPFFVRLREYTEGEQLRLPGPEQFLNKIAPLLAPEEPEWPREQLRTGQAFVLVDGIDEVHEARRPAVMAWLRELTELFPNARYVVTMRPGAIDGRELVSTGFTGAVLEPMDPVLVQGFIDQWHAAMRLWQKDADAAEQLMVYRDELLMRLDDHRFLGELANTPLLAGLICALNQHLNGQLPRRRGEIFEKALAMFHERDRKREVTPVAVIDQSATYHLLGDLALWMVRNSAIEVPGDTARGILKRSSASLPSCPYEEEPLYRQLLLRSGLLREPTEGHVDFVHRTFQEYLAAKALVEADNIGEIVKNASDDQWREVVILASGLGNTRQTTQLLRGLMNQGTERYQRRLIAIACLDEVHGANREILDKVERAIPTLLPPRSLDQSEALSHAGDRLVPYLERITSFRSEEEVAAVVRAAALIGGTRALDLIATLASMTEWRKSPMLRSEYARSWQYFVGANYMERVLLRCGIRSFNVPSRRQLLEFADMRFACNVKLSRFVQDGTDLSALDNVPVRELEIKSSDVRDLNGVIRPWPTVRILKLTDLRQLRNVSALTQLPNLAELQIHGCANGSYHAMIASRIRIKSYEVVTTDGLTLRGSSRLPGKGWNES